MLRWFASVFLISWLLVRHTHGFGSGAPVTRCGDMMPKHSEIPAMTSAVPYLMTATASGYNPGDTLTVTMTGINGQTHRGFLIVAEDINGRVVGSMVASANQKTLSCGNTIGGGITHTEKGDKQSCTFQWQAPSNGVGDVIFKATVLNQYTTFWVKESLLTLPENAGQEETTTESTPAPTTKAVTQPPAPSTTPTPQPQTSTFVSTTAGSKLTTPIRVEEIITPVRNTTAFAENVTVKFTSNMKSSDTHQESDNRTESEVNTDERPTLTGNTTDERPTLTVNTTDERPTLTGNTTDERPTLTGNTTDNRPTLTVNTTDERPTLTGNTTDNRPTFSDNTTDNRPTFSDNTTDNRPTFSDNTTDERPTFSDNTTDERPTFSDNTTDETPTLTVNTTAFAASIPTTFTKRTTRDASAIVTDSTITTQRFNSATDKLSEQFIKTSPQKEMEKSVIQEHQLLPDLGAFKSVSDFTTQDTTNGASINLSNETTGSNDTHIDQMVVINTTQVFHNQNKSLIDIDTVTYQTESTNAEATTAVTKKHMKDLGTTVEVNQTEDVMANSTTVTVSHYQDRDATTGTTLQGHRQHTLDLVPRLFTHHSVDNLDEDPDITQTRPNEFPMTRRTFPDQAIQTVFKGAKDGKITYDPECGSSKGCFVKCDGESCDFMITWRDIGNGVRFEIYGKPEKAATDAWVAVGFSTDTRMGEDSVTECVHTNGMVQAFNSYNPGYSNARLNNPQRGLSQIQGNYINGILMCSFVREKRVLNIPQIFDLDRDWHIMYANGRALSVPAWTITMHSLSPQNYPQTSAVHVDYQSYVVVGSGAKYPLVKAHGCLMIFAWVLFTGIGIVTARYYKNVWADKTFMKLKIWFQLHRYAMVAAVLCNAIAIIIIFVEVGGYSNIPDIPGKSYLRSHPVLGIIITVLSITNPIMALLRPSPDHSRRVIFNWAHWGIGMAAYILSMITICFGFQLGKSHTPDYAIYIMIAYVIYIIIFDITLETMEILAKREQKAFPKLKFLRKGKVEQVEMTNTNSNGNDSSTIPNGNTTSKGKVKQTDRTKTILLAVHFAFTGTFALVLILVVALN